MDGRKKVKIFYNDTDTNVTRISGTLLNEDEKAVELLTEDGRTVKIFTRRIVRVEK